MKRVWIGAGVFAVGLILVLLNLWSSPAFSGLVVDEEGHPVEGAIVMAGWRMQTVFDGPLAFRLAEARTNQKGEFTFEKWGPIFGPRFMAFLPTTEPWVYVLHDGHRPVARKLNPDALGERQGLNAVQPSFSLIRLSENHKELADQLSEMEAFDFKVYRTYEWYGPACIWKSAPLFVEKMRSVERRLHLNQTFILTVKTC